MTRCDAGTKSHERSKVKRRRPIAPLVGRKSNSLMNLHCLVSPRAIVGCGCGCRYRVEERIILFHSPWTASPTADHKSRHRTATSHKKIKYTKSMCTYRSSSVIKFLMRGTPNISRARTPYPGCSGNLSIGVMNKFRRQRHLQLH